MKMCIVSGIFPPDIGGPASYVPKITTELQKLGHEVCVVCLSDRLEHNDTQDYPFPVIRIRRQLFKPWRLLKTVWTICQQAKNSDLLYVNGLSFESMLAAFVINVPTIHKVVGDYAWERSQLWKQFQGTLDEYQVAQKGLLLKLLDWVRNIPLQRTTKVIVPSFYLQRIARGWGIPSEKIQVIYNAVETQEPSDAIALPPFDGKTIITVGRLVPWKGIDTLIKNILNFPNLRLVIVGDGPERSNLLNLAQALVIDNRVLFMGSLAKEQVFACLKQADGFVLNSSYEGLPHAIVKAMSAGIPIVATDAGGTNEVVKNQKTGILIPVGDNEALQNAINTILNNPELTQNLVDNAKNFYRSRFTCDRMVEEFVVSVGALNNSHITP